jgi:geranylgeranyl pyrophosphate synthase
LELLRDGSTNARTALDEWMADCDCLEYARRRAEEFARQARKRLELLPESPSRSVLELMTHFVLERRN